MPFFLYASFPNSRARPRSPTTKAVTFQVAITSLNDAPPAFTLISAASLARTYIILENFDQTYNCWYIYATPTLVNPTLVATFGVLDQLLINGSVIYKKTVSAGTDTNWVVVPATLTDYQEIAEKIAPAQTATLESLENIYAIGDQPVATTLTMGMDEGRN